LIEDGVGKTCQTPDAIPKVVRFSYFINSVMERIKTIMDGGTEADGAPGDVAIIPPGHNSWVVEVEVRSCRLETGVIIWLSLRFGDCMTII
jgi:hypothetical protein